MCKTCNLTKILIVIALLSSVGIVAYFVVPWDDILDTAKERLSKGSDDTPAQNSTFTPAPVSTLSASPSVTPEYQFMQCPDDGDCCNGLETNCNLRVNEIMFASMHNANHDSGLLRPQNEAFELGLDEGYRSVMLDLCECDGALIFCHGFCFAGNRDVLEVFTNIISFLNDNPTEIIVINIEISVNNPTPLAMWELIKDIPDIQNKTYVKSSSEWPLMKSLVDDGSQLIMFQHRGPDCSDPSNTGCTPEILDFFDYTIETDYSFPDIDNIKDINNSCPGRRGTDGTGDFYAINNFLETPLESETEYLNSKIFLEERISNCENKTGLVTNFVNIDFFEIGDLLEVVQTTNKARGRQ